jgi:hypothetical protein
MVRPLDHRSLRLRVVMKETKAKAMAVPAERLERKAPCLAAVDKGYLVFRRHLLTEMSPECQQKIRETYDATGFVNESCYSFEIFGFYTDFTLARDVAAEKKGSWMEVPVNSSLPDLLGRYRSQGNPGSDSEKWYEETNPGAEPVCRDSILELATIFSRCMHLAKCT